LSLRAVLFDVFGTLMPYKDLPRHQILSRRANLAGMAITPERMKAALDTMECQNQAFAIAGQLSGENVARDRAYWVATFGKLLSIAGVAGDTCPAATVMCDTFLLTEDFYLDAETLPLLRGLKQEGLIVGVISNAPKGLAKTLEKYGILQEVAIAVGSQDVGIEKPDPAIFRFALDRLGLTPAQAAYVGDEYMTDARAAQAVGMLGIFLDRHNNRPVSDLPRITRLSDLLAADSPLLLRREHSRDHSQEAPKAM
jgi:putative hydrolase of the HAD superfamily